MKYTASLLLILLFLTGCGDKTEPVHNARILAFGTLIDVAIINESRDKAEQAVTQLEKMFQRQHKEWHAWEEGPLQQANQRLKACESFSANPVIMPLLKLSQPLAEQSEHLFNPAIGNLIDAWGFQGKELQCDQLPTEDEVLLWVQQAPRLSDLTIDKNRISNSNPAVKLDFGAIGKGYGIDLGIEQLKRLGIDNALINAGGDLRAIGDRGGRPWRIAVRNPTGGVFAMVEISGDESVFTSGDYERNFRCNGKLYHHIIDPRTGMPAQGTHSVTVIHSDAATADAAATALFIAGPEQWHRIASRMGIRYVALLDDRGVLHMNPAMRERLQLLDDKIKVKVSAPITTH